MKTTRDGVTSKLKRSAGCIALLLAASIVSSASGQQPAAAAPPAAKDPDLPQPFDVRSLSPLIANSPFNRAVNISDSLVLTGMASVDGKPMVTLMDKELKRTYVVTDEPNENGWKLAEPPPKVELKKAQVKISMGAEVVTIRHDREGQEESMKKDKHSPGGNPGQRDPSADDKGYKRSGSRGPTSEQRERFEKLSDGAKEKVRSFFRDNRDRMGGMTDEQRRSFIESNIKPIAEADESGRSGK